MSKSVERPDSHDDHGHQVQSVLPSFELGTIHAPGLQINDHGHIPHTNNNNTEHPEFQQSNSWSQSSTHDLSPKIPRSYSHLLGTILRDPVVNLLLGLIVGVYFSIYVIQDTLTDERIATLCKTFAP